MYKFLPWENYLNTKTQGNTSSDYKPPTIVSAIIGGIELTTNHSRKIITISSAVNGMYSKPTRTVLWDGFGIWNGYVSCPNVKLSFLFSSSW